MNDSLEARTTAGDPSASSETPAKGTATGHKRKHLVFALAEERYCIALSSVKEVIRVPQISALPQVPKFVRGLINLRGQIITVLDLRMRLSLGEAPFNPKKTCIVIVEASGIVMGFVVDDVNEVIALVTEEIELDLDIPSHTRNDFVAGVARDKQGGLVLILDVDRVMTKEELLQLRRRLA